MIPTIIEIARDPEQEEQWGARERRLECRIDFPEMPRQQDLLEISGHGHFMVTGRTWHVMRDLVIARLRVIRLDGDG